jgi:hypothetical protein
MKNLMRTGAVAVGAALAVTAALPAQAATASGPGLTVARTLTTARINGRLATLNALELVVTSAQDLTGSDRTTLGGVIQADISGLTALRAKVAAETTIAGVHADAASMIDNYRVYMLVWPKVHLTNALEIETVAGAKLQTVHDELAALVAKAPGGGTAQEQSELAGMQSQIQAAQSAISGEILTLQALQPGPDGNSITAEVKMVTTAARTARQDLRQAQADAKDVRAALQ